MIQKKCAQYWPDEGSLTYGGINVTLHTNEPFSDFIIRTFSISKVHGFYISIRTLRLLRHVYTVFNSTYEMFKSFSLQFPVLSYKTIKLPNVFMQFKLI